MAYCPLMSSKDNIEGCLSGCMFFQKDTKKCAFLSLCRSMEKISNELPQIRNNLSHIANPGVRGVFPKK